MNWSQWIFIVAGLVVVAYLISMLFIAETRHLDCSRRKKRYPLSSEI